MSYIEVLSIIAQGEKDGKYPDLANIETLMREKFEERLKKSSKKQAVETTETEDLSSTEVSSPKEKKKWWRRKKS